ncbi:MAG: L-aspartate oxidase [Acetobacteraceae bacterium]|nr:L-aspartate oxidase [Acetobacteraceae bacterium]
MRDLAGRPVIIGGGLAGLMTALHLAPEPVVLLAKSPLGAEASSAWAQGGIAAALGADDSPALHLADTLAAGNGLCDPDAARRIVYAAPDAVEALIRHGVRFDRTAAGALALGREAAHSRRRIVHAAGDGTGREIMRALARSVGETASIEVWEGVEARRLLVGDDGVRGIVAIGGGAEIVVPTRRVVIATGGVGGLFLHSTNPGASFGQGLALAARAGAALVDLEFVQFHPTALATSGAPLGLVSEAVRGEGAVLIDECGERFMASVPGAELAPRDVVARAIWRHHGAGHRVFLDARAALGERFAARFPAIAALCAAAGIDPAKEPIPVRPAAHYHMGGIAVDGEGQSTLDGLWACGEAASTGLHGANRLASNSLLEAVVSAQRVADSVAGCPPGRAMLPACVALPPAPDPSAIRPILWRAAGVLRYAAELADAAVLLRPLAGASHPAADPALVGLMIVIAALNRTESRGAHFRTDHPAESSAWAHSVRWRMEDTLAHTDALAPADYPLARKA